MIHCDFLADVLDPTYSNDDRVIVSHAYCRVVELHLSVEGEKMMTLIRCWRSKKVFEEGKPSFAAISISVSDTEYRKLEEEVRDHGVITSFASFLAAKIHAGDA